MDRSDLPSIGDPGSAAEFQLNRLREWGLAELADNCTSREQALLVHHCAMYVRNVWRDVHCRQSEPPAEAVRRCVEKLTSDPELLERTQTAIGRVFAINDDAIPDMRADPGLFDLVKTDILNFDDPGPKVQVQRIRREEGDE